jgi:hypothetical protein
MNNRHETLLALLKMHIDSDKVKSAEFTEILSLLHSISLFEQNVKERIDFLGHSYIGSKDFHDLRNLIDSDKVRIIKLISSL